MDGNLDMDELKLFLLSPLPKDCTLMCNIIRSKGSLEYPKYYLKVHNTEFFLLNAKKKIWKYDP